MTLGSELAEVSRSRHRPRRKLPAMGFDPTRRIRRNRTTRRGDLTFLIAFGLLFVALIVWAML